MSYDLQLTLLGLIGLLALVLPRLLAGRDQAYPMLYVLLGLGVGALPFLERSWHPLEHQHITERVTELGVILSLMGCGLKLDRPLGWHRWSSTWRLLAITMPMTIVAAAFVGWWVAGLLPVAAFLVGAIIAPTDPVLASDVQVGPPGEGGEGEVRFALTSEAGLNDGLAFPFTNAAIAAVIAGSLYGSWIGQWLLIDVLYKVIVGLAGGIVMGFLLSFIVFQLPGKEGRLAQTREGFVIIAMTILSYGATELVHGYGFIAVFVAGLTFRSLERRHKYHRVLHDAGDQAERTLMAILLVLFGAAIMSGLFAPLTWKMAAAAFVIVLLVRPVTGLLGLVGGPGTWKERAAISFFGIRGIGSFYYLAYALNHAPFEEAERMWAFAGFIVLVSLVFHGTTARLALRMVEGGRRAQRA